MTAGIGLNVFLIGQRLLGVLNIAEGEVMIEAHSKEFTKLIWMSVVGEKRSH